MLLKFITRSLRPLGMIIIFLIAAVSIFASIFVRNIDASNIFTSILNYTISFENRFYDFRMKSVMNYDYRSNEIVLVKIDDYSLQKIGVWPIPRTLHAQMIDKLRIYGAKVAALDVLYPERSPSFGNTNPDEVFIQSIKNFQQDGRRVFISYNVAEEDEETLDEAPVEMMIDMVDARIAPESGFVPKKISKFTIPFQELLESEVGLGNIQAREDPDGVFRHYQLVANVDNVYFGSLALNAYEAWSEKKNTLFIYQDRSGEYKIDDRNLEVSQFGEIKIRYIGAQNVFPEVSLYDLLNAPDDDPEMKKLLEGKLVFVGSTALGAHDLRPSPLNAKMPGVYQHMNAAHMLIHKYFYKNINDSIKYSLIILVVGMIIFFFTQRFGNAIADTFVTILLVAGAYYIDQHFFLPEGYELKLFYCFFCFISCYSWNTFLQLYETAREKKHIKGTFARYVAPTVVDEMLKDPSKLQVGGSKMDITCLFSDVRDFTKISEGLSATELAHSLNIYMGAMTDIVFETKGTLDKYIGDAIVALWGAPLPIGNHAQYAVEAAIRMINTLPSINEEFKRLGRPTFNVGIGLNSGECSVGNMGSSRIFSYTALGDNMNLGARLESLCKYYGAQILISEMTLERLDQTKIKCRPIDKVIVKGKSKAVGVYEVLHDHHWMTKDPESLGYYMTAYKMFQDKQFTVAMDIFNQLLMANEEDKATKRLRDLCKKYIDHPELVNENFDVTTMTEK